MRGLAAINATTGAIDTTFNLPISRVARPVRAVRPGARRLRRRQVAGDRRQLQAGSATPSATRWRSSTWPAPARRSRPGRPTATRASARRSYNDTYIRGIDISPDSTYFVVNTTGAFFGYDTLCDTTVALGAAAGQDRRRPPADLGQPHRRRHLLGGRDHRVGRLRRRPHALVQQPATRLRAATTTVRARWSRPGIAALDPYSGVPLSWNPGRDRGRGVEALYATDDYLMVGTTRPTSPEQLRQRLALLPVAGGTANPVPQDIPLPVKFFYTTTGDSLTAMAFDGIELRARSTTVSGPSKDGDQLDRQPRRLRPARQAELLRSVAGVLLAVVQRHHGRLVRSTNLSTSVGYVDTNYNLTPYDQPYGVAETRTAAFKGGRVLYTKTNRLQPLLPRPLAGERDPRGLRVGRLHPGLERRPGAGVHRRLPLRRVERQPALPVLCAERRAATGTPRTLINSGSSSGIPWSSMTGMWATK